MKIHLPRLHYRPSKLIASVCWVLFFVLSIGLTWGLVPDRWQNYLIMVIYLAVALTTSVWRGIESEQ